MTEQTRTDEQLPGGAPGEVADAPEGAAAADATGDPGTDDAKDE